MQVRIATLDDVPSILTLGVLMFEEAKSYEDCDFDQVEIENMLAYLIGSADGIVLAVEKPTGEMVGFYVGAVVKAWFSRTTRVMCEHAFYIHPESRGGQTVILMLSMAFAQAKTKGATKAELHTSTGVRTERTERLYGLLGMTCVGGTYHKKL